MKITIDIPRGYERDFSADKFKDFFSRVIADMDNSGLQKMIQDELKKFQIENNLI